MSRPKIGSPALVRTRAEIGSLRRSQTRAEPSALPVNKRSPPLEKRAVLSHSLCPSSTTDVPVATSQRRAVRS
ncbi:MAG: hypothetical protein U0441_20900 [Polyangiaceae bacterium]